MYYHVDGELVPAPEATVSVADRGFRYGDAVFETVRVYGGRLFEWERHADRLATGCARLQFDPPPAATLRERVAETLAANDLSEAAVRLSVTRGVDDGGLTPPADPDPTVVVTVRSLPRGGVDGTRTWDGPATLQTVKTRHQPASVVPADAKTHNYLGGVLARLELGPGADEAVVRDVEGHLTEGTTSNLFLVTDAGLYTPSLEGPVLPGVARAVVLELAADEGIPVAEGTYDPDDLRRADEAFVTSTTREVRPVGTVDGIEVGGGPVTALLSERYDRLVEERSYA
jgi:branched-chain amino acid aminotransferase